jgi:hypothetical protein
MRQPRYSSQVASRRPNYFNDQTDY